MLSICLIEAYFNRLKLGTEEIDAERDDSISSPHIYYNNDDDGLFTFVGGENTMDPKYVVITDGSAVPYGDGFHAASAWIIVNMETMQRAKHSEFKKNHDSSYAELYAVKKSIEWIMDRSDGDREYIMIVSDSKSVVTDFINNPEASVSLISDKPLDKLRRWFISRIKYNSMYCMKAIHIKSHKRDVKEMRKYFDRNGVHLNKTTVSTLMQYNQEVDELAKETLEKGIRKLEKKKG